VSDTSPVKDRWCDPAQAPSVPCGEPDDSPEPAAETHSVWRGIGRWTWPETPCRMTAVRVQRREWTTTRAGFLWSYGGATVEQRVGRVLWSWERDRGEARVGGESGKGERRGVVGSVLGRRASRAEPTREGASRWGRRRVDRTDEPPPLRFRWNEWMASPPAGTTGRKRKQENSSRGVESVDSAVLCRSTSSSSHSKPRFL
jgi:hypothetical protein